VKGLNQIIKLMDKDGNIQMAEIHHGKSSDSQSSAVLEGSPPKADYTKTILMRSLVPPPPKKKSTMCSII
jgi:hypothetical protein